MTYTVLLRPAAERDYRSLPGSLRSRIRSVLLALEQGPRPPGTVKLTNYTDRWHIRVGDYRIIYTIDDQAQEVTILRIVHRRDAYR